MLDDQQKVEIDPKSADINLDKEFSLLPNKNDLYGNIITIKGADGKYYAINADYKEGWFDVSKKEILSLEHLVAEHQEKLLRSWDDYFSL